MRDLNRTVPPPKVDVVGDHLDAIGLAGGIRRVNADVREEKAFRELLDCDVVLCGTNTHGSRAIVNDLTSAYLLPVIDVGVRAGAKKNGGRGSARRGEEEWRARRVERRRQDPHAGYAVLVCAVAPFRQM
jgi:hypothetical protein